MNDTVLIINEYYSSGGAEVFFHNLIKIFQKKKYKVFGLVLNPKNYTTNDCVYLIDCSGYCNKTFFNYLLFKKIRAFISTINPDFIIVNNVFSGYSTVYRSLKGYKVYQVVHDYKIICPNGKSNYLFNDCVCSGYNFSKCIRCEGYKNYLKMFVRYVIMKKCESIRKREGFVLISPSKKLQLELKDKGYESFVLNNPIFDSNTNTNHIPYCKKTIEFLYVGLLCDEKGIFDLIRFFKKYNVGNLTIIGGAKHTEDKFNIEKLIDNDDRFTWLGKLAYRKTIEYISQARFLIVPSKWVENYPTTVLEAMMQKTMVIGSNRGGIPEMLEDGRGFVFDFNNFDSLKFVIDTALSITSYQYEEIVANAYKYVSSNNSYSNYYNEFFKITKNLK